MKLIERTITNGADLVLDVDHAALHLTLEELLDLLTPLEPFTTLSGVTVSVYLTHCTSSPSFSGGKDRFATGNSSLFSPSITFCSVQVLSPHRENRRLSVSIRHVRITGALSSLTMSC